MQALGDPGTSRWTYTMSLSQSAQMFCPGGRPLCGVVGCGFVSGADTDRSPARAGDDGVITTLWGAGSAVFGFFCMVLFFIHRLY